VTGKRPPFRLLWCDAIRDSDLSTLAKTIAFVMSTYMDGRGVCYPGRARIAKGASCAPSTVQKVLAEHLVGVWLERLGPADATERQRTGMSTRYRGVLPNLTDQGSRVPDRLGESGHAIDLTDQGSQVVGADLTNDLTDLGPNLTDQIGHEPKEQPIEATPLPPQSGGRRSNGTNPRALERERRIAVARSKRCSECETGGGMHVADCPRVTEFEGVSS